MRLRLGFRDLEATDLGDLDWSGGSEHVRAVADALTAAYADEVALVVGVLDNDRLLALGGVDFRPDSGSGRLWMLSVHERFQGLGVGRRLIARLERRVLEHGRTTARLSVELDNPRAATLYRRLGYREVGPTLDRWPVAGGRTYVAACVAMARDLRLEAPAANGH